jgi:hypothetical protein
VVEERRADGVANETTLSTRRGGSIGVIAMGGSGLGDAIVAWPQGTGSNAQIAASVLDAPPDPFVAVLPIGWQRKDKIRISWAETLNAISDVTYSVSVADEPVVEGLTEPIAKLGRDDVEDGRPRIQVFAADQAGQETGSIIGRLLVDRSEPKIRMRRRGRTVAVTVSDGPPKQTSGVGAAKVAFGDGTSEPATSKRGNRAAKSRHQFEREGRYKVVVWASDEAGNKVVVKRKVRIR